MQRSNKEEMGDDIMHAKYYLEFGVPRGIIFANLSNKFTSDRYKKIKSFIETFQPPINPNSQI
jgi:hypothetical protein